MHAVEEFKLRERIEIRRRCEIDQAFRLETLFRCKEDRIFWCNNFAITYNPRVEPRKLPFILWPRQEELVRFIDGLVAAKQDGIVEKSRDTGVSYVTLIPTILHPFLFGEFNALVGSRKEEAVDKSGDSSTLFWKLIYNLNHLPQWMLPDGFDFNKHVNYMRITRPDNENTITGESSNDSFARGGRYNLILFDEFGFWPSAQASWESAGEATPTRLAVSTPPATGRSSYMYKLATSGRPHRFTFHYKSDPRKDERWEAEQRQKKSIEEFNRELNISYEGTTEGTVYGAQFALCELAEIDYNPELPLFVAWDVGRDGTALQWYQWDHKVDHWFLIDSFHKEGRDLEFFVPFVTGIVTAGYDYTEEELKKIQEHRYWKRASHFGGPDFKNKSSISRGESIVSILKSHGIQLQFKEWKGRTLYDLRQVANQFLRQLTIDTKRNGLFCDAIRQARYPKKLETSQATTEIAKPIHDWTSHHRSAMEYMADNRPKRFLGDWKNEPRKPVTRGVNRVRNQITGF
jgi:hypothetical protein